MATLPDTASASTPPAWRQRIAAFWRWWTGELVAAMPERLAAMRGAARVPVVSLENEDLILVEPRNLAGPDARVALQTLEPGRRRAAVTAMLERSGESRARARLVLAPGEALVRRTTLPAATEENLRQVLAFEMDRLTPFRVDDVYFDDRVLARDAAAGTISVLVAVARREIVDARIASLRALGVNVQGVTVRDDLAAGPASLELMPSEQRGARESRQERMTRMGLAWLALILFIALLAVPIWRKREAVIALQPQLARAEAEAKSTDTVAKEVERLVADYNFLLGRKYASYPALAYLEDLSRLLPDNTWLQQMDLKQVGRNREVTITGETPSSSKLIEILQQSKVLQNARTSGTVTRGSVPGTERFMITAEAMARPAPEARSALEGAPAPGAAAPAAPVPVAPVPAAPSAATPPAATPNAATPPGAPPPTPAKVQPIPPASGNQAPAPSPVPVKPSAQPAPALPKPQQVAPTQDNPYGAPWLQNVPKQPPKSK